ncbi:hypothetical protein ACFV1L_24550 [Kitasatospora sp. NPDC059646]|uniref:hypothetical protein n=1 Tax=Kitasatospora sp. NPDC059646 TaxID=3346893 RepID=UPI0036B59323
MTATTTSAPDADAWAELIAARGAYSIAVSQYYDQVLHEITDRVRANGTIGKADIGALLLWKRLRADASWVGDLMALSDAEVRAITGEAVAAVHDTSVDRSTAARNGRRALTSLPGFGHGDALASALLTAAAPSRMAVYDRHTHRSLHRIGLHLTNSPGRYARYIALLDHLLATGPQPATWTARDLDIALYWHSHIHP